MTSCKTANKTTFVIKSCHFVPLSAAGSAATSSTCPQHSHSIWSARPGRPEHRWRWRPPTTTWVWRRRMSPRAPPNSSAAHQSEGLRTRYVRGKFPSVRDTPALTIFPSRRRNCGRRWRRGLSTWLCRTTPPAPQSWRSLTVETLLRPGEESRPFSLVRPDIQRFSFILSG